ncbi:Histone-fold [Penicillium expansum]|uniref:Histone-fold n=1 Tax=Penicillium expansum TaxID=27334 RepID=A0A0A2KF53_PENEN|nr:Histone-fold [Penicillium expansum]KGO38962.1 Histone-fold [Penicillium expansum]KGO62202.1 Histone-fold [Penicillium expansum]KGO66452.1 Histone-fold [Penicillium expansum]
MSVPNLGARSVVELWMQCRDHFGRSLEELMLSDPDGTLTDPDMHLTDPDGTLTDPDMLLTDPDGTLTDLDMLLTDCTITSPVNAPCADSALGLDFSDDISMHSVEDVSGANQDHLLDDSESDLFSMGEYFHENYTQLHSPNKEGLPRLRLRLLCIHIFNLLGVRIDSAVTSSETSIESQEDHGTERRNKSGGSFTNNTIKMMFVSGETAEPSPETTTLIEEITRQQVIEILTRSTALATRRGVRSISTDDLIFLIRHDKAKVSRLRTFLSWKDVRKNVKDSDDKGGGDAADFAAADDAAGVVAGPQDVAPKPKNKRAKVGLAWDVNSFYSVQVPEREDEEDEEEEEQNYATLQRLAAADERTRHMTREEYVFWSECRQASFTYRKSKRFREWAGFGIVTESKPNDDIVDILGFLTFEIVQTLTEEALKVKEREDNEKHRRGGAEAGENLKKRKRETGLFDPPEEGRTPIEPRHVREAYRKLQATPQKAKAMLLHNGRVPYRFPLALI